jgi:hypothetical protein
MLMPPLSSQDVRFRLSILHLYRLTCPNQQKHERAWTVSQPVSLVSPTWLALAGFLPATLIVVVSIRLMQGFPEASMALANRSAFSSIRANWPKLFSNSFVSCDMMYKEIFKTV